MFLNKRVFALASLLLIASSGFAQTTQKEPTKIQMDAKYQAILQEIKNEALRNDPEYMSAHKEEAITQEVIAPTTKIPKRLPDKFVRIYILPFTNSAGVYQEVTQIFKYKDGAFITSIEGETADKKPTNSKFSFEGAN